MSRIVWVFGASGTGKKTWMLQTANTNLHVNPGRVLIGAGQFETIIPVIVPNRRSGRRDPNHVTKRTITLLDIHRMLNMETTFLIHGQSIDITEGILKTITRYVPHALQTVVFMNPRLEVYQQRAKERGLRFNCQSQLDKWQTKYYPELEKRFDEILTIE